MQPVLRSRCKQILPSQRKRRHQQRRRLHVRHRIRPRITLRQQRPRLTRRQARPRHAPPAAATASSAPTAAPQSPRRRPSPKPSSRPAHKPPHCPDALPCRHASASTCSRDQPSSAKVVRQHHSRHQRRRARPAPHPQRNSILNPQRQRRAIRRQVPVSLDHQVPFERSHQPASRPEAAIENSAAVSASTSR